MDIQCSPHTADSTGDDGAFAAEDSTKINQQDLSSGDIESNAAVTPKLNVLGEKRKRLSINKTNSYAIKISEEEMDILQKREADLDTEIADLRNEGYLEQELQWHIEKMHEYNEIKDIAQMVLGRLAELEGVTTKDMYAKYGLDLDD